MEAEELLDVEGKREGNGMIRGERMVVNQSRAVTTHKEAYITEVWNKKDRYLTSITILANLFLDGGATFCFNF